VDVPTDLVATCRALRDEPEWRFEQLIDLTGVDYLDYGRVEWNTETATASGFSRGRSGEVAHPQRPLVAEAEDRAVGGPALRGRLPPAVRHAQPSRPAALLVRGGEPPLLDSVVEVWKPRPTGTSARRSTCSASCSAAIPTCGAS
jgi:NADH-quinone oxidoreductase subunit C